MASYNKVTILGNITRDLELRYIPSGEAVLDMGMAINERGKDGKDHTTFVDVTAWGKTAELVNEYMHKGSCILVDGRLKSDSWEDKETGKKRSKLTVTADRVVFLDKKGE